VITTKKTREKMRNKLWKVERIGKLECGDENLTEKENSTEGKK
jgi:hypothetical protein